MFNGRHCIPSDYKLLENATSKYIFILEKKSEHAFDSELNLFIDLIKQFDADIAEHLRVKIFFNKGNYEKCISIVKDETDELKRNVLVDIREH